MKGLIHVRGGEGSWQIQESHWRLLPFHLCVDLGWGKGHGREGSRGWGIRSEKAEIALAICVGEGGGDDPTNALGWTTSSEEGTPALQRGQDPLLPPRLTQHWSPRWRFAQFCPDERHPIAVVTARAFTEPSTVA